MTHHQTADGKGAPDQDPPGFDNQVRVAQLDMLVPKRAELVAHIIAASLLTAAIGRLYPAWIPPIWLVTFFLVTLMRCWLDYSYRRSGADVEAIRRWGRLFTLGAVATGSLWGLTATIDLVTANPLDEVLVLFVLAGVMTSTMLAHAAYPPAMIGFMAPTILPSIGLLVTRPNTTHVEMGLMLVLYAGVLINTGRNTSRSITEHIRTRIRRDHLTSDLRASEAALVEAQALAGVGSWDVDLVNGDRHWSAQMYRIFGIAPATTAPSVAAVRARVHPDDVEAYDQNRAEWSRTGKLKTSDHRIVMDDGAVKWVHTQLQVVRDAVACSVRLLGIVQDITERREADDRLALVNTRLATLMDASPTAVILVDANLRIVAYNKKFEYIFGVQIPDLTVKNRPDVLPMLLDALKYPDKMMDYITNIHNYPDKVYDSEIETRDNRILHQFTTPVQAPDGGSLGRAWFFTDVTNDRHAEARRLLMSRTDGLTGLPNRVAFVEALEKGIADARNGAKGFAVISVDLDRFKDVNDTLGRAVGDELLKAVSDRLRSNCLPEDTIARLGADEFAILATGVENAADVGARADKLIEAFTRPLLIQGGELHAGASLGLEIYTSGSNDPKTLLSHAGMALDRAKLEGCGVARFFTHAMDAETRDRVSLGVDLRNTIAHDRLFVVFQPQVSLATGRMTGVEALVRWRHPTLGLIGPNTFIPLAERMGLIGSLGSWVLWTACRQAKDWLDSGAAPLRMCVNVSALQFSGLPALEAEIAAALATTGLPPELLELELTESVLMSVSREHDLVLPRLRRTGVTVAIDDFGTGYSSFDYLRRFPVDRIKIAQNFITDLESACGDRAIVRATIGLARELHINVIAEGVETQAQSELLKSWGCGEAQGYYFARPLAAEDVGALLHGDRRLGPKDAVQA